MRTLIALLVASSTIAAADGTTTVYREGQPDPKPAPEAKPQQLDPNDPQIMSTLTFDKDAKANGYMAVVLGHLSIDSRGDNLGRMQQDYSSWMVGVSARAEYLGLRTVYGGRIGATFDLDAWLFTGGSIESKGFVPATPDIENEKQSPNLAWFYFGIAPAIGLGLVKTSHLDIALELGGTLNTDFYGLTAGVMIKLGKFSIGYKLRSGDGYYGTHVLDERIRIGYAPEELAFVGLDITHGYNEDEMSRSNLGALMKGGYTLISLVLSGGK